jgi:hypothetical protein
VLRALSQPDFFHCTEACTHPPFLLDPNTAVAVHLQLLLGLSRAGSLARHPCVLDALYTSGGEVPPFPGYPWKPSIPCHSFPQTTLFCNALPQVICWSS